MIKNLISTCFIACILFSIQSCKKAEDGIPEIPKTPDQIARELAMENYHNNYLGSNVYTYGWSGNISSCTPGSLSDSVFQKVLQRINYYRALVDLEPVLFDSAYNSKAQQAALMMHANGSLSHNPPTSWSCYTAEGASGASNSNLNTGGGSGAINAFMVDDGSGNQSVGHRRWVINSAPGKFGYGTTGYYTALYVVSYGPTPDTLPPFVAWPTKGYMPAQLVPGRWSMSAHNANFLYATVSMTDSAGNNIVCNPLPAVGGAGDNSLVWEPAGIVTNSANDKIYHVTVSNVMTIDGTKSYSYDVKLFQAQ